MINVDGVADRILYVAPDGDADHDGLSPDRPLRTIQDAADLAEPGDLILVRGGMYFEQARACREGTRERPIVFRAAAGQTALVTFGVRPGGWTRETSSRFVYSASFRYLPACVWEDRTVSRYVEVLDRDMLEDLPGSFLHDADTRRLFVHPLRGTTPEGAGIVAIPAATEAGRPAESGDENPRHDGCGFRLLAPHVRVEGFTIAYHPRAGVELRADFGEARGNTVYGCLAGIAVNGGNAAAVEGNLCFRNHSHGIVTGGRNRGVAVRDNVCADNGPDAPFPYFARGYGLPMQMAVYGKTSDISFVRNTVVSKAPDQVWRYKTALGKIETTHNVIVGGPAFMSWGVPGNYSHNTVVGGAIWSRDELKDKITPELATAHGSVATNNLFLDNQEGSEPGFADPARNDYRLRADSPFLGTGAFPEAAPLRYVSPDGDDAADGRTPKTAWKTFAKAAGSAGPGETVYVLPGVYAESVTLSARGREGRPLAFKTHGRGRVVLDGEGRLEQGLRIQGSEGVVLDRFIFRGFTGDAIRIQDSAHVELVEVVVDGSPTGVSIRNSGDVRVLNCTVTGCGRGIEATGGAGGLVLRNTLFSAVTETAIALDADASRGLVSERNALSMTATAVVGRIADRCAADVEAWRSLSKEGHPSLSTDVKVEGPEYLLPVGSCLAFQGAGHGPIGARGEATDPDPVLVEDCEAASIQPDQAVVTWCTPCDYVSGEVAWRGPDRSGGPAPAPEAWCLGHLKSTRREARLTGLLPGQDYRAIVSVTARDGRTGSAMIAFSTPHVARPPAFLHVSPNGDDRNDGDCPEKALRTLRVASLRASPGDTVLVHPGTYREKVEFRCGGLSPSQRLAFRSVEPGRAVLDLGRVLPGAISAEGVRHIAIEGFHIRGLWYSGANAAEFRNVVDLVFSGNSFELPARRDEVCSSDLFRAWNCREVTISRNCFNGGFDNLIAKDCDRVTIDHNTFYLGGVSAILFDAGPDAHCRITNNIFVDVMAPQKGNAAIHVYRRSPHLVCDYNLFWRDTVPRMGLFGFNRTDAGEAIAWTDNAKTLGEMRARFGLGGHSLFADPLFVDAPGGDMRLKAGSPAAGAGEGGSTIGACDIVKEENS